MPQEDRHIYRSADGVLGGVCAGFAQRFDMDVALVRLLVVIATLVSAGAFVIAYLAAWLVLPAPPQHAATLDVDPTTFRSEVYEHVVNGSPACNNKVSTTIPPVPPQAASSYYRATPQFSYATTPLGTPSSGAQNTTSASSRSVTAGLVLGILFITLGAAALLSAYFSHLSFLQFWPLVLIAAGVVRIVIPARDGSRVLTVWLGLFIILFGLVALASSLGVYTFDVDLWANRAGPLLLVTTGLFIMGRASKSNILIAASGLALVLFLVVGAYFSLHDGPTELGASVPFNPECILMQDGA